MAKKDEVKDIKSIPNDIWMAGLGVLKTAAEEGTKLFQSFVDKGTEFQEATREATQKQLDKVSSILKGGVNDAKDKIETITSNPKGIWDKLGLGDVSASTLNKLGYSSKKDLDVLSKKINKLSVLLKELKSQINK